MEVVGCCAKPSVLVGQMNWSTVQNSHCYCSLDATCNFTTTFEVDFGDMNNVLDDSVAQSEFSFITTSWINERNNCKELDEVYYSFYFTNNAKKQRRQGTASGKCKGRNCPRRV